MSQQPTKTGSMGVAFIYHTSQANSSSLKKSPQLHSVRYPSMLQLAPFFGTYPEALCSLQNACYSHRAQYIPFPPMGVTGTWPELPERALNIICILIIEIPSHFSIESMYTCNVATEKQPATSQ